MGLIYVQTQKMLEEISNMSEIDAIKLDEIKACCTSRLTMLFSPLHATKYVLHPLWRGKGQENDHNVNMGWIYTIMRYTNGSQDLEGILLDELNACALQKISFVFHLLMNMTG